jgi:O-antigen/teichoic acid export membrane protein
MLDRRELKARLSAPTAARTAATWASLLATLGCTLLARTLIARILGPVGVGLYALMLTSAWLAGTVLSIGLPAYNASFSTRERPAVLLANSAAWSGAWLVVLVGVCTPLLTASMSAASKMIIVGVMAAPLFAMLECSRGILQGTGAIAAYNWLWLSAGVLNVALVAALAAMSRLSLTGAVASWVLSNALAAVAALGFVGTVAGGIAPVDRRILVSSFRFGAQAWLSQLTGILNFRIALLLTQGLLGTAAVGLYSIAITIAEILFYLPNALAVVTVSRYASASPGEARELLRRSTRWVLALNGACGLAGGLAGLVVIPWVFGASYAPSSRLLLILLPGVIAYTPVGVSAWYFNAHLHKPSANLVVGAASALLNGCLTLLWAPRFGIAGVAWAATTGYICGSLLNAMLIRHLSPASPAPEIPAPAPVRRILYRALSAVDFGIAGVLYFLVPRHVRAGWVAPGTVLRNRRAYDEVVALLDGATRALVLDVGGGIAALGGLAGRDTQLKVVTLDLDYEMLHRARVKIPGSMLVCADGTRLPFPDDAFDAVVMVHALEHIPEPVRPALASEIKRVSRRGVVIHGPAGEPAIDLARRFIDALVARGGEAPRYAIEHLQFAMPMPEWFTETFPGCELQPRRNLQVELAALLTGYTPIVRWMGGYRSRKMAADDDRAPFVEWTMRWRKPAQPGVR